MTKLYFVTNTIETRLPTEFVYSKNPKYISIINTKLMNASTGKLLLDVSIHSDFVVSHPYLNGLLSFCNEILPQRKKWQIKNENDKMTLHFRDLDQNIIDPATVKFVAEFLLEF